MLDTTTQDLRDADVTEVSRIFAEAEQECEENFQDNQNEDAAKDESSRMFVRTAGKDLNELYELFLANRGDWKLERDFLLQIQDYANRAISQQAGSKGKYLTQTPKDEHPANEVVQDIAMKVWSNLDKFDRRSKFSSWVYEIAKNATVDHVRKLDRRTDKVSLTALGPLGESGALQGSGRKATIGAGPEELAGSESGVVIPKHILENTEDTLNEDIDYERFVHKLSRADQQILQLTKEGCKSEIVAKEIGRDSHWVRNQLARIREKMHSELGSEVNPRVIQMLVHSCRLTAKTTTEMRVGELYIQDGSDYREVSKCRCSKWQSKKEVLALVDSGEAQPVYRLKDGQPFITQEVWLSQSVRVPRCGLNNSRAHIEKAYGIGAGGDRQIQSDIEFGHEITVQGLRDLIAPFRPDPWKGRAFFTNFTEERTTGGYTRPVWRKPEEKPKPADRQTVILRKDAVCPNCRRPRMVISVYPDGSTRYDHGDCYLNIFRPPVSKAPVSNVLVLSREEHSTPVTTPAATIPDPPRSPAIQHEVFRMSINVLLAAMVQGRPIQQFAAA
jgi:RNA polymerase sigma factor (sigma-70 family)